VNRISLVISDVDGTLVTPDKRLTEASVRAVRLLHERGINFTVNSSRPPMGVRMLVGPDLKVIEQHLVPEPAARQALDVLAAFGADLWVFTTDQWLVRNPTGEYVQRECQTIQAQPSVVADFGPYLLRAAKVVGSSMDFARLAECEVAMREALAGKASVARSQPYYLDVTAPNIDKGSFVDALSHRLAVPPAAIATLGDMENDLTMFRKAGLSIAMGNASAEVKRQANYVTDSNSENGFARAIARYILDAPRNERIA
jgi:Cof subfamily protein (haloacid dehalogenase superfamily)